MRLNKYLALCGLGSRRAVEQLITGGEVAVGGQTVTDLATQVDAVQAAVTVQGHAVRPVGRRDFEYIMLNKPRGYDVTRGGRHHHRRAWDLLPKDTHPSVQSVGRLDRDSTGLLLFTNDGELAFRLTHPSFGCRKVYDVEVEGNPAPETLQRLTTGVPLEDGPAHAVSVDRIPGGDPDAPARLRIVMEEGRNRIVRRLCEAIGHPVVSLNRSVFGPLHLNELSRGKTRPLSAREVGALRRAVGLAGGPGEKSTTEELPARPERPVRPEGRDRPEGRQGQPEKGERTARPAGREKRGFGAKSVGQQRESGPRQHERGGRREQEGRSARGGRSEYGDRREGRREGAPRPEGWGSKHEENRRPAGAPPRGRGGHGPQSGGPQSGGPRREGQQYGGQERGGGPARSRGEFKGPHGPAPHGRPAAHGPAQQGRPASRGNQAPRGRKPGPPRQG